MKILKLYEKEAGQSINLEKSSIFFSKNMIQEKKAEVVQQLGKIQTASQGKYLGLHMLITKSKEQVFRYIRDSIRYRAKNWKSKMLSPAGKEMMLKAVSMAMPVYTMSCFKLSSKLCRELSSIMAKF